MSMGMDGTIDRKRLIFPALGELYDAIAPYSYAIIRFCAGVIVMPHGYMKLFGPMAAPVAQIRWRTRLRWPDLPPETSCLDLESQNPATAP